MVRSYHRFDFGKYRGVRVDHVAEVDPYYIWHMENVYGHTFTPAVKRIARTAADRLQNVQRRVQSAKRRRPTTRGFY